VSTVLPGAKIRRKTADGAEPPDQDREGGSFREGRPKRLVSDEREKENSSAGERESEGCLWTKGKGDCWDQKLGTSSWKGGSFQRGV